MKWGRLHWPVSGVRELKFVSPIKAYLDLLVFSGVRADPLVMLRHRGFIASRLLGGVMALCAIPLYLALAGLPDPVGVLILCWLLMPLASAFCLSRTGRWDTAHLLSAGSLAVLVGMVAAITGGSASFALAWLVVVPLEAALSSSRRVVMICAALALGVALVLVGLDSAQMLPASRLAASSHNIMQLAGLVSAGGYAMMLALGAGQLFRITRDEVGTQESRYAFLAENATDMITRHGRQGNVLCVSPASQRLIGIPEARLHGQGLFERVHVADRPAYLKALSDTAESCAPAHVELRLRKDTAEGVQDWIWVQMQCRPVAADGSDCMGSGRQVIGVFTDITHARVQAEEILRSREEAERANAAKTHFLATMSHELRTPLNAVIGFSEMLLNEEMLRLSAEKRLEYAQLIHQSGEHLLGVVNDILDMSKIEAGKFDLVMEPFDVGSVIGNCCELLDLKAQRQGITLTQDIPERLPELCGDRRAVKQILLNLLANAIKFTNSGGRVTVKAHRTGTSIRLCVSDTGIGISAQDLDLIGTPFFQAQSNYDRQHEGTGLGLSVVRGLVDLHGGRLDITSEVGIGTQVEVILPVEGVVRQPVQPSQPVLASLQSRVETASVPQEGVKKRA